MINHFVQKEEKLLKLTDISIWLMILCGHGPLKSRWEKRHRPDDSVLRDMLVVLRNFIKFANSKVRYSQGNHRNRFPVFYGEYNVETGWAGQAASGWSWLQTTGGSCGFAWLWFLMLWFLTEGLFFIVQMKKTWYAIVKRCSNNQEGGHEWWI